MRINGTQFHTIWVDPENDSIIKVIDQCKLPFEFRIAELKTCLDAFQAIQDMVVRGAPLIGVTGAYGIYLALLNYKGTEWKKQLINEAVYLKSARPTAVNLPILLDEMVENLSACSNNLDAVKMALTEANRLKLREIDWSDTIGNFGCTLIEKISKQKKGEPVNILTHCNAGWLACID